MTTIETAIRKLRKLGEKREEPLPAIPESALRAAESQLGIAFPASYKTFLEEGRDHRLHFEEFLWIGTDRDLVSTNMGTEGTLPAFFVSFLSDGYGTQICFDTRRRRSDGEYAIVEWERGMQPKDLTDEEPEPVADDLPSWLLERLDEEQEEL